MPRYLARLGDGASLLHELGDPAQGPMLATLPAGLLVLGAGWGRVGPWRLPDSASLWICAVLVAAGAILSITLGLTWFATVVRSHARLESVNGGWLIPPVINLLVPIGLAPLISANPGAAPLLVLVGFAFLGVGAILFLAFLTLLIARLAMRGPLPPVAAPSLWIPLAPAGIGGLACLRLAEAANDAFVPGFTSDTAAIIVSAMGLGFAAWWAAFAAVELHRVRAAGGAPVHPGWWSFVFPVGAMTMSISAVGASTNIWIVQAVGLAATAILMILWASVSAATLPMLGLAHTAEPTAPAFTK